MAKVSGPLMSVTASGSIGGTVTLLRAMNRNIAKRKSKPSGPPSAAQLARRAAYAAAAATWSALSPAEKLGYKPQADQLQITPFNYFMRVALFAFSSGSGVQWDNGAAQWDSGSAVWS